MAPESILSSLQALCVKREYCKSDIMRKALKLLEGEADAQEKAEELVASLISDKFVSDERYACAYAREKACFNGWGPVKIRMGLRAKDIGNELIDLALDEVESDKAEEKLEKTLTVKWRSLKDDPNGKLKLIRFALSRGHNYDFIRPVVEKVVGVSD